MKIFRHDHRQSVVCELQQLVVVLDSQSRETASIALVCSTSGTTLNPRSLSFKLAADHLFGILGHNSVLKSSHLVMHADIVHAEAGNIHAIAVRKNL